MAEIAVRLYRKQNPDGTSKDWAYPLHLSAEALMVYYGRTGLALRCAQTPRAACKGTSPYEEAQKRAYQKRQKGYQDLGDCRLDAQHRVLTSIAATPTPAVPAAPVCQPGWYWRWTPRDDDPTVRHTMEMACLAVTVELEKVGWPLPAGETRLGAARLYRLWSVRDRTEGCAWRPDEPLAIAAFWLLLSRALPELRLVDHRDRPVTAWPRDLTTQADLRSRLQPLGLIVSSDPDWRVALPETAWFY